MELASIARTSSVCSPGSSAVTAKGEVQGAKAGESSAHSNVSSSSGVTLSVPEKANVANVSCVSAGGPAVKLVAGGAGATIVHS